MLQPVTQKQHAAGLQFYEVHSLMEVVSWIKTVDRIGYPDKKLPQDIHNKQHTACTACIILCNIKHPVCTGAGSQTRTLWSGSFIKGCLFLCFMGFFLFVFLFFWSLQIDFCDRYCFLLFTPLAARWGCKQMTWRESKGRKEKHLNYLILVVSSIFATLLFLCHFLIKKYVCIGGGPGLRQTY